MVTDVLHSRSQAIRSEMKIEQLSSSTRVEINHTTLLTLLLSFFLHRRQLACRRHDTYRPLYTILGHFHGAKISSCFHYRKIRIENQFDVYYSR